MTIQGSSPTIRETQAISRGAEVIVEVHAGFLALRRKRHQERYTIDYESLIDYLEMRAAKALCGDIPPRKVR